MVKVLSLEVSEIGELYNVGIVIGKIILPNQSRVRLPAQRQSSTLKGSLSTSAA